VTHGDLKPNPYKLQTPPQEAQNADVVFVGPAYGADKNALLQSAHAFILPSLSEGLPMSVLEAWAAGLPVVMTPECNLPEGFACRAALEIRNDEDVFRQGLQTLLEMTDGELVEMGLCGRRLVEEKFTWSRVAAQMHRLYKDVMER
jgi:poly(glycerol-phosphate) alpha-glucosyltransferase